MLPLAAMLSLPPVARAEKAETQAKALFKAAQKAYDLGNFDEALKDYTAAYDAKPLPGFLFNIAQCHRQRGEYERAAFFYKRFLDTAPKAAAAETAQKLLAEVQAKQAELDKQKQAEADAKRQKDLDESRAAAARAEADAATKRQAALQAQQSFDARKAAEARASHPGNGLAASAPTAAVEESPPAYKRWWFWTGIGAAVVAGCATAYVVTLPRAPDGSLGTINAR
ncbi:MAG: tetratricopeptide repeat protein [Deltaproteobacteria bacterium]|nr:tetratricopeptide repeat protein [Deltaproteobacteria bacterium]